MIDALIDHGARLDDLTEYGCSALTWAIDYDNEPAVMRLLERGANVNLRNSDGDVPLKWATGMGKLALARILLDFGADPNIPDNDGYTALDEVQHDAQMTQLLLKYGAVRGRST